MRVSTNFIVQSGDAPVLVGEVTLDPVSYKDCEENDEREGVPVVSSL